MKTSFELLREALETVSFKELVQCKDKLVANTGSHFEYTNKAELITALAKFVCPDTGRGDTC